RRRQPQQQPPSRADGPARPTRPTRHPRPRRSPLPTLTSGSSAVARTARARPSKRRTVRLVIIVAIRILENGIVGHFIGTIIPGPFHLFHNPPDWRGFLI